MKRRWLAAMTMGLMMAGSSVCMAMVAPDAIALGGVGPGSPLSAATAAFGTPNNGGDEFYFPNGIIVDTERYRPDVVDEIKTYTANNVSTPAGIHIGSPESAVTAAYGNPDKRDYDDGAIEYTYYSTDYSKKLKIDVVNGSVVKINCKFRD